MCELPGASLYLPINLSVNLKYFVKCSFKKHIINKLIMDIKCNHKEITKTNEGRKQKRKNKSNKQKTISNVVNGKPATSIIKLHVNSPGTLLLTKMD